MVAARFEPDGANRDEVVRFVQIGAREKRFKPRCRYLSTGKLERSNRFPQEHRFPRL